MIREDATVTIADVQSALAGIDATIARHTDACMEDFAAGRWNTDREILAELTRLQARRSLLTQFAATLTEKGTVPGRVRPELLEVRDELEADYRAAVRRASERRTVEAVETARDAARALYAVSKDVNDRLGVTAAAMAPVADWRSDLRHLREEPHLRGVFAVVAAPVATVDRRRWQKYL